MQITSKLQQAFNNTKLGNLGYTLETAMQNKALAICLNRLVQIKAKRDAGIKPARHYWYQEI